MALVASVCTACSTAQIYGAGQAWQKAECNKMTDAAERRRCMASADGSFEKYQRDRDAARAVPASP